LRARPDIRAAERQLAAQTARIGVAEADLYPRFALNGNFALLSNESGDVFESGSRAYGFGPSFRWNLFNMGRVRSQIDIEESKAREALLAYENAVLEAVEEVETSMSGIANERDRLVSLKLGAESAKETVFLVKDNYAKGLVDFQNVLDAERTATRVEDSYAVSQGLIAKAYVVLYSALGGGFLEDQVELTPAK
jgi:outer membrane protein TolC